MTPAEYRERMNVTQLEAALDFNVTPNSWYRWERDGKFPRNLSQLAEFKLKNKCRQASPKNEN